jgi:cyanophycinase
MIRAIFLLLLLSTLPLRADFARYWSGNEADVRPELHGPLLLLAGGGGDVTAGLQTAIERIGGGAKIDVVVLRASGDNGYNDYFMEMRGVDSVASMVITDRESASRPDVVQLVRDAELIYFAGGDQCNYIRWIKGTPIELAVEEVWQRGGAIGGTSAGLAIQGEYVYDACPNQSAQSAQVLLDPFSVDVSVSTDFFAWPPMRGVITDTHFQQRDRLGRLVVFLARSGQRLGLGVNEGTLALVDRNGVGEVHGQGPVHLVIADQKANPERGKPLTYRGLRVLRFEPGETFDLRNPSSTRVKSLDVVEGRLSTNPY